MPVSVLVSLSVLVYWRAHSVGRRKRHSHSILTGKDLCCNNMNRSEVDLMVSMWVWQSVEVSLSDWKTNILNLRSRIPDLQSVPVSELALDCMYRR
jgi:hypothetical protein